MLVFGAEFLVPFFGDIEQRRQKRVDVGHRGGVVRVGVVVADSVDAAVPHDFSEKSGQFAAGADPLGLVVGQTFREAFVMTDLTA